MTDRHTYWVSIGRNSGKGSLGYGTPMQTGLWLSFRSEVRDAATLHGEILASVDGQSSWDGLDEESYLVLVSLPADKVATLRSNLSNLAAHYQQDAIGLVGGDGSNTLVTP